MLLSPIITTLLSNQGVSFKRVTPKAHATHQPALRQTHASVSVLKDDLGFVMAIYLQGHQLDLSTLRALTDRAKLRFTSTKELENTLIALQGCSDTWQPNCPEIQLIIDEPISNSDTVFFVSDNPAELIQVDSWDMQIMIENALIGGVFSHHNDKNASASLINIPLCEQLKNVDLLPAMPMIATQLLALRGNPDATVDDMVRIISRDPALTAQVLRYANSALFGFCGQIANLHDAIFRVLGYETVLYMSFGAALGRAFKLPQKGRLSMGTFWQQATHRAALCQQLALRMPGHLQPTASVAYVTGLLHNIGILLMRRLFQTEFDWLNKMLSNRPEQGLIITEQNLFGCTHSTIGKYVMQHWNMPGEITTVVAEHHTPDYSGPQAIYVWISQLAGQALKAHGLSDSDDEIISEKLCRQLELNPADVDTALEIILEESKALNAMADTLCA